MNSRSGISCAWQRGFTLVEVMLSLAMSAVIVLAVYATLRAAAQASRAGAKQGMEMAVMAAAYQQAIAWNDGAVASDKADLADNATVTVWPKVQVLTSRTVLIEDVGTGVTTTILLDRIGKVSP
jgi:prepilin-type N-terminal cleavage/methylation domain-containing protein